MNRSVGWIITGILLAIARHSHAQGETGLHIKSGKDTIDFYMGDELVTRYHTGGYSKPIFWPVNAPGGIPLTRNHPAPEGQADDHPHHKSAWFCYGDVMPEGIDFKSPIKNVTGVDFWSESKGHGKIAFTSSGIIKSKRDHVWVNTKNEWQTAGGMKILDESRTLHLYSQETIQKAPQWRLIVLEIDLHASVCPITFNDTKEGAFAIRINDVINAAKNKGKIQNAEGKIGEKECWGQKSAWCDYSGTIDGKEVGLAIFDDPKNPHPACWHVRGYGLMAANPFGREMHAKFPAMKGNNELVRLKKGEHLHLRYGMLLHTGDAVTGEVAAHYQRFVKLRTKE